MSFNLEVFILFNHTNPTQLPADNRIVALFCQSPRIFQIKTVFVQLNFVSFLQQPRNIKMSPNKPGLKLQIGEGNGTPLQYSCLENPMDGGAWWATGHGVPKSRTRLSDFSTLHKELGPSDELNGPGFCPLRDCHRGDIN